MWTSCRCLRKPKKRKEKVNTSFNDYPMGSCCDSTFRWTLKVKQNIVVKTQQNCSKVQQLTDGSCFLASRRGERDTERDSERGEREKGERPFAPKSHVTKPKWHHSVIIRHNGQQQETASLYLTEELRPSIRLYTCYTATFPPIEHQEQLLHTTIEFYFRHKWKYFNLLITENPQIMAHLSPAQQS